MDDLIHADIFFFVTTIAVILLTICVIVALFYLIRILRNLRELSETMKNEGHLIASDIGSLREKMREEGFKFIGFMKFINGIIGRLFRHNSTNKNQHENNARK